jgi:arginine/lysine/ornithine decarboxylase
MTAGGGTLLITPTDWGTCADIAGVARVCHDRDLPLIVDDAWGAHLPFHPDLPAWGMDAGAGLVVTSVHKMGAPIEQISVFQLQHDRMNPDILFAREDLLGTASSSLLVYLTLDGWRRRMVEDGKELARRRARASPSRPPGRARHGGHRSHGPRGRRPGNGVRPRSSCPDDGCSRPGHHRLPGQ